MNNSRASQESVKYAEGVGLNPGEAGEAAAASHATALEAEARVSELRARLTEARTQYYEHDEPIMSDGEYDALERELAALEEKFPELKSEDSPTETVGGLSLIHI